MSEVKVFILERMPMWSISRDADEDGSYVIMYVCGTKVWSQQITYTPESLTSHDKRWKQPFYYQNIGNITGIEDARKVWNRRVKGGYSQITIDRESPMRRHMSDLINEDLKLLKEWTK